LLVKRYWFSFSPNSVGGNIEAPIALEYQPYHPVWEHTTRSFNNTEQPVEAAAREVFEEQHIIRKRRWLESGGWRGPPQLFQLNNMQSPLVYLYAGIQPLYQ
jgi:hypothetical protein